MRKSLILLIVCAAMVSAFAMTSVASAQAISGRAGNSDVLVYNVGDEHIMMRWTLTLQDTIR
ncbi:MAG: hypothetical protein ACXVH6_00720 [Halobacteriota archaeon]